MLQGCSEPKHHGAALHNEAALVTVLGKHKLQPHTSLFSIAVLPIASPAMRDKTCRTTQTRLGRYVPLSNKNVDEGMYSNNRRKARGLKHHNDRFLLVLSLMCQQQPLLHCTCGTAWLPS
jgi:hypothetical protein